MNDIEVIEYDFFDPLHRKKLVELMNEYISDEMGGGELIKGEKILDLINGLQSHPSKLILFAKINGQIIGLTNCFVNFGTFAAQPIINIHDIIVIQQHRGKGVGRALMNNIEKRANEIGCAKVTLEVREDNYNAQKLYKSLGFGESEPKMLFWTKTLF
ncbi:MAG: GNAT family N-acetyltransferase [Bacteroidales bacterium]|nr:GNAT family N-acetyltransferase [Bacteroidales bacterium]